jgi:hypothetical protein
MKRKLRKYKITKPPLHVDDFMCRRCRVQATREPDRICGICRAFGKCIEPSTASFRQTDHKLAVRLAASIDHWFRAHHLIGLNDAARDSQKAE